MDGSAVKEIAEQARRPQMVGDRLMAPNDWKPVLPEHYDITELDTHTLTGVRDYIGANRDKLVLDDLMLHVTDHGSVDLIGRLETEEKRFRRHEYLCAAALPCEFRFGVYLDAEDFMVGLQTQFLPTTERESLLRLIGSIREQSVREVDDDGLAQQVTTSAGVTLKERQNLPNPINLIPFRTFREVAQPMSLFVLRARGSEGEGKPKLALFEADGGQWKIEAIQSIAAWLRTEITGIPVIA